MTFYEKATLPHLFLTYCAIGGLIGGIASIYAGRFDAITGVQGVFIWTGLALMSWHAWANKPTWREMLKAKQFWIGVILLGAGNIFSYAFSN